MRKIFITALIMTALAATACGEKSPAVTNDFNYKVGTASYTHTNDSYGYTEGKNGRGAVSTTLVAAVFDNDGKIVRISIDEVESNIGFDATGQLADFTAGEVKSKKELGDAYGMKAVSSIGKEWYEQVESLERWLEGKPASNIIGGASGKMLSGMTNDNPSSDGAFIPKTTSDITRNATSSSDSMSDSGVSSNSMSGSGMSGGMMQDNSMAGNVMSGANSIIDNMTDGGDNLTGTTAGGWMDEDLKASVTIDTTYIEKAIEKAYRNAK